MRVHCRFAILALAAAAVACGSTAPTTAATTIGPDGGTLTTSGVTINVPPGALATGAAISVSVATSQTVPSGDQLDGRVYAFAPAGLRFASPITVTFPSGKAGESVFWTEPGSSTQFAALPTTIGAGVAVAHPTHFSSGFVGKSLEAGRDGGADAARDGAACATYPSKCVALLAPEPDHYYVDLTTCDMPGTNVQGEPFCLPASSFGITDAGLGAAVEGWCCCGADGEGCFPAPDSGTKPADAGASDAATGDATLRGDAASDAGVDARDAASGSGDSGHDTSVDGPPACSPACGTGSACSTNGDCSDGVCSSDGKCGGTVTLGWSMQGTQTWNVPAGVTTITVTATGGTGGSCAGGMPGGLGGSTTATFAVVPGEPLNVAVAKSGICGGELGGDYGGLGGWSGNGMGTAGGANGGGASSVTFGTNRIFAGGGGGSGGLGAGGAGGGLAGASAGGGGGTQSAGGVGGIGDTPGTAGGAGTGGAGASTAETFSFAGGGGGAGYYGGGGGGAGGGPNGVIVGGGGGGGGSSYVSGGTNVTMQQGVSPGASVIIAW